MNTIIISLAALIPCVLLCWYIYAKDAVEKEPIGLITLLFLAGAALALPAILLEGLLVGTVDSIFSSSITHTLTGLAEYPSMGVRLAHNSACGFVAIALVEELAKWLVLVAITHRNKNFNYLFDGIVYSVFVSMGFAAVENVRYAVMDGWDQFILRCLDSVPGHLCFGVIMGMAYTVWHAYVMASDREKELASQGVITVERRFKPTLWLVCSLVIPVIVHGCYSTVKLLASETMSVVFYVAVVIIFGICFFIIRNLAAGDTTDDNAAHRILVRKYPEAKIAPPVEEETADGGAE